MNKEFVTYEQALALKELGFDEKCLAYWFNETPLNPEGQCLVYYRKPYDNVGITNGIIREYGWAPIYQQAFRWFREKHNLFSEIQMDRTTEPKFCFVIFKYEHFGNYEKVAVDEWYLYRTYEEAEKVCLDKLIEIIDVKIKNRG
jgi:hypothetical protein